MNSGDLVAQLRKGMPEMFVGKDRHGAKIFDVDYNATTALLREAADLIAAQIAGHKLTATEATANLLRANKAEAGLEEALRSCLAERAGRLAAEAERDRLRKENARMTEALKEAEGELYQVPPADAEQERVLAIVRAALTAAIGAGAPRRSYGRSVMSDLELLRSDQAIPCHRQVHGEAGGATIHCVVLADGFIVDCGSDYYAQTRAKLVTDAINSADPSKFAFGRRALHEGERG